MIGDSTARMHLPLLHAGQAQKEIDHNEALALIDLALHPLATSVARNAPPDAPEPGDCWIVGPEPIAAWAGHGGALAGWTAGGWRFVAPREGTTAAIVGSPLSARYDGEKWIVGEVHAGALVVAGARVVGPRQAAIAGPDGGAIVDREGRTTLLAVLAMLRTHGLIAP